MITLALVGWTLAALLLGLWLGERGRRLDAQRREGVIRVDRPEPARVIPPGGAVPERQEVDFQAAREKYIADAVREGFTPHAAAEDWDRLMSKAGVDQGDPWGEPS
jgi:hypothetical protein